MNFSKLLEPFIAVMRIFRVTSTYDPRNDPDIRDVAERQNAAIGKIVEKRGIGAPDAIFDMMTEESWASPDDSEST